MIDEEIKNYCTLVLVRHGETEGNVRGITIGQQDSPLTENGKFQAQELRRIFKDMHVDELFSSDTFRVHHTAQILNIDRKLAIQTSQALRERAAGKYEGRPSEEFYSDFRALLKERGELSEDQRSKLKIADDIESDEELISRFIRAFREISVAYPGKRVLVVTHGGAVRTLLIHLGYASREQIPRGSCFSNCGYMTLRCDGIDFFIDEVVGLKMVNNTV